jgi:NADH dehydrogenase/NADH:ubiquinone oxidoreductase subunit G
MRIREIDDARVIVVVATDLEDDAPIIDLRVKKAVSKLGAKLLVVYPEGVDLDRHAGTVHIRNEKGAAAAEVAKLGEHELLRDPGGPVAILFGDGRGSEDADALAKACADLAAKVGGKVLPIYRGTNERGALAAGVAGWDRLDGVEALLSWGPPPTAGIPKSVKFLAAWDHLPRPELEHAAVVLPSTTFAEQQGSLTNLEGRIQFLRPPIGVRPPRRESWEVLTELAAALGLDLGYTGIFPLQRQAAGAIAAFADLAEPPSPTPAPPPVLIGPAHP